MAISAQRIEKVKLGFQAQTGGIDLVPENSPNLCAQRPVTWTVVCVTHKQGAEGSRNPVPFAVTSSMLRKRWHRVTVSIAVWINSAGLGVDPHIREMRPRDLIYIQSFIWVLGQKQH